jgi:HK97 family phage major capsid protein
MKSEDILQRATEIAQDNQETLAELRSRIDDLQAKQERPQVPYGSNNTKALDLGGSIGLTKGQRLTDYVASRGESLPDGIRPHEISLGKIVRGICTGNWRNAEAEQRVVSHKAMGSGTDAAGGYTVPTLVSSQIIDMARAQSVAFRAGARLVPIEGTTKLPVLTTDATAAWKGQNNAANISDLGFGCVTFTPKTCLFLTSMSVELLEDAGPDLEQFINTVFARKFANELDRAIFFGAGTDEPIGAWNNSAVSNVAVNGALTNYAKILDARQLVLEANAPEESISFVMPPRSETALAKLATGIASDLSQLPMPREIERMSRYVSTVCPTTLNTNQSGLFIGNVSSAVVGMRTQLTLEAGRMVSADAIQRLQLVMRGYFRADVGLTHPLQFCRLTGCTS